MTIKNEGYQTEKINVKKTKAMRVYKGAYKKVGETALIITIYGKALETNKTSVGLNQHQYEPVKINLPSYHGFIVPWVYIPRCHSTMV